MDNNLKSKIDNAKALTIRSEISSLKQSSFLAFLSHEFRTPMNSVMGMLRLLMDTDLDDQQLEYVESARSACRQMLSLVRKTTDFSSKKSTEMDIEKEPFNLCAAGKEIISFLSAKATVKKIQLKYEFMNKTPLFIISDSMLIKQVVAKLVENGINSTEKGSINVIIDSPSNEKNIANIRIRIINTGPCLTVEKVENVFDFTSEVHNNSEAIISLDLSVCKFIINSMGGDLILKSNEESGTQFTLTVPCEIASDLLHNKRPIKKYVSKKKIQLYTDMCKGLKILVAEDDPINRSLAVAFITRLGGKVETANNGAQAVDKFKSGNYDLIFMDCEMPIMNGYEATKEIRKLETTGKKTPILAMTAYAAQGDRERCLSSGMDDHIPKPVTVDILQNVVQKFIIVDTI